MVEENSQEKIQQKYMQLQMLDKQMVQVQKQLQQFDVQLQDLVITKDSLEELKKTEIGSEVLSTISPGIFIKTKLEDNKDVIMNVGGNIATKKNVDDAKKMVEEQTEEIKKVQYQLTDDLKKMSGIAMNLEKEMNGLR